MRKALIVLAVVLMALAATGCAQTDIRCGIDGGHSAYLGFEIKVNLEQVPKEQHGTVRKGLNGLIQGFYRLGFIQTEGDLSDKTDKLSIVVEKREEADSEEAAFEKLKELLTDEEFTPFSELRFERLPGDSAGAYFLEGTLDAQKLLATANISDFPKDLAQKFEDWIAGSSAQIAVTLPATQVAEHSGSLEWAGARVAAVTPVSFQQSTQVLLKTQTAKIGGEILTEPELESQTQQLAERRRLLEGIRWGAGGVLAICAVLLIFSLIVKRKKAE